jgi:hypothetical protein
MTAIWGPLGWMTLHSISACYPEYPSNMDKQIINEFMDSFGLTITCSVCNGHFSRMFKVYKSKNPNWNNSRLDLFVAICRMHNDVNIRINKPVPKNIGECLNVLQNAIRYSSQYEFRKRYIEYLQGQWKSYTIEYKNVLLMKKINEEYWNKREISYEQLNIDKNIDVISNLEQSINSNILFPKFRLRNVTWAPQL